MKKNLLRILSGFALLFTSLLFSADVKAQTSSTTVFDFDSYTTCDACGDDMSYGSELKDSLLDATPGSYFISSLKVKIKFFTCSTDTVDLYLNNVRVGAIKYTTNLCACNACDSIEYTVSGNDISKYYKYGKRNVFSFRVRYSGTIYVDRIIVYRTQSQRFNYDAGIASVDSPSKYVCSGSRNIVVRVSNNGKKQFTGVDVNWKWNGATQTATSHSGTLDTVNGSGSNSAQVKLGSKTFTLGKADTLIAWSRNPGGVADSLNNNDTIKYVFFGGYGDTITVGGTSPMFSTIQSAVTALMTYGICSPTFIKIRPGTYNEQVSVGPIPGVSATNTVTFLSSNNDSSSVVINFAASSTSNYTVRLINTAFIKFHKVTIEALSSSYGTAVAMMGDLQHITFMNCHIIGMYLSSTSSSHYVINRSYSSSVDRTININFLQCRVVNGSYGFYCYNSPSNYGNGFYIRNCVFEDQYYINIYCVYARNVGISGSRFERNSASYAAGGYGIYFTNINDSCTLVNNRIFQNNGTQGGIYLNTVSGSSTRRNIIANNFISASTSSTSYYVFYMTNCTYTDVLFNNLYHKTNYTSSYAFYSNNGSNIRLFYNNVFNADKGLAFLIASSNNNSISKSDRNNFYNSGTTLGTWYNVSANTINDLKILGFDSASVSVNPNYASATDLHTYHVDLDGRAKPYNGLMKDIDGQPRNSTTPDVGADEFKLATLDAGISGYIKMPKDSQCVKVILKNHGTSTLTSVKIDWKINGVTKTQYNWSGTLAKGDTDIVCLGTIFFKKDTLYKLKAWTSAPNGGSDSLKINDTLNTQFYPSMRGIYTIGGTTPDYATFTAAVNAIETVGIIDSVFFKVRNGTYTEQLEINNVAGAERKNAVVFESESKDSTKVILQFNSATSTLRQVIWLNGARGISFRRMTIKNYSVTYRYAINMTNFSRDINFENNIIQNPDSTSSNSNMRLFFVSANGGQNINILNNRFIGGSYGLYFASGSSNRDKNVMIIGNTFRKQGYVPVYLQYLNNIDFSQNDILTDNNVVYYGFYWYNITGPRIFSNNKISIKGSNAYYGVYLDYSYSPPDTLQFFNNFIYIAGPTDGIGLYDYGQAPANFYYNNILNECTDSSSTSAAFMVNDGILNVFNNNFVHMQNGYAVYNGYYDFMRSDNNNYYTTGTDFVYEDGDDYTDLADYFSGTGHDKYSLEVNPMFTSSSDLHIAAIALNAKAKIISKITKDIDGETRNSSAPDIGADEFVPATVDAGVSKLINPGDLFKASTLQIEVVVTNFGLDTIKKVTVQAKINKDTLSRKYFTRTIAPGDTIHVKIGSFLFKADSVYNILSWSSLPNGVTDQKKSNDTIKALNRRPAMSGVYTIGGTTPNFPTFKAAVNAMNLAGIADSVRFRVRSGTYTEQLIIPQILGAGMRNSIIFESQNQDTTSVTLQFNSTKSDTNWVVQFNGADGITFRYLKIKSTSTSNYCRVFSFRGKAVNNTLHKNIIEGPNTTYGGNQNALIYMENDANNDLHIKDNHIKNGDYAVYAYGYYSGPPYKYCDGLEITNNRILNPYNYGLYIYYFDSIKVTGNYIYMDKYTYNYPIEVENVGHFNISHNTLVIPKCYIGLYLYNCGNISGSNRSLLSNNTLLLKNTAYNTYGFYIYYNYYTDFIHNTIKVDNTYSSTNYGLYMYYGDYNTFYNNIFSMFGSGGYAIYQSTAASIDSSDMNDLYTKGSVLGYYAGSSATDLAAWQSLTPYDDNSVSVDPLYKGTNNLHVKEVSLNAGARYFKKVHLDMDYETRDSLNPDIGADEFQLPSNDAGISKIIVPNKPFPSDSQNVKVVLKNYGGNPLYVVKIDWKFNGVSQTTVNWSDTLYAGDTMHVNLGIKEFLRDSAYSLKAWTSLPNGTGDSIASNDTLEVKKQYPALSGVYTIGGASPDFSTFTEAIEAMKKGGIIDWVRFDVRSGTYYEQVIIPYIYGAVEENDIVFQSEQKDSSKVILIGSNNSGRNYVVRIDSCTGVTFRYMSLRTIKPLYYNHIFELLGACKKINIHDCNLDGKTTGTYNEEAIIYLYYKNSNHPSFTGINIFNNRFQNGAFGVYSYGYSSIGSNSYGSNLNIYDNNFENQYYIGLYLYYTNNFSIKNNKIYNTSTQYSNDYGIQAQYCVGGYEITGNQIYNREYVGLYLYECDGAAQDTALVANNFIHCRTNNAVYGAQIYYPDFLNFVNNNIHVHSTHTSAYAALYQSPSRTFLYNNNFTNTGAGVAMYLNGSFAKSNFNNLYSNGSNLAYRSGNISNLAAWKSSTGQDANSISSDPDYISNSDLHVRNSDLNAKGRNHKYLIKMDIDAQKRDSLTPDIGADEFIIPSANDAGISAYFGPNTPFASGVNKVKVYIKNYGFDSLKSATIHWRVNGTSQTNKSWTGKLKTGQSDTITIGTFNFSSGKKHDLKFWTTSPNGDTDTSNYNDTLEKKNIYAALKGVYTVEGTFPDYPTLADAFTALSIGGVIDSVWFKMRSGTYTYNINVTQYPGAHPKRPVYIEAQTGDSSDVILKNINSNPIIQITGADYLRFRKISFHTSSYYMAIRYEGLSNGLGFENCHFKMPSSGYGIYSGANKDDSLTVKNCRFENGYYGIYTYGYLSSGVYEKGIIIKDNVFTNPINYGLVMQYADAPIITGNAATSTYANNYPLFYISNTTNAAVIAYNKLYHNSIYGNALYFENHTGSSTQRANIYNNFFSIDGSSNGKYAAHIYTGTFVNFFHNSINVFGSNSTSMGMQVTGGNNLDLRNNIFSNPGGGYAAYYASTPGFTQLNYNDIYTGGTTLGHFNGTNYSNLAAWKTGTGKEANSISLDPAYTSNTDLHSNLSSIDSACLPISTVSNDIDLETRNTTRADIGADEFQSLANNLGIATILSPMNSCGLDSTFINLKIFNYGNQKQSGFSLRYKIDGGAVKTAQIADTVKPGKELNYQFTKKESMAQNTTYKIVAWTDLSGEMFRNNDTSKLTFTNYSTPDSVTSMVPADGTTGLDYPFSLSWLPSTGATKYDLYFWKFTDSKPSSPNVSNLTQISYQINNGLTYGEKYRWQVVAKNPVCSTPGIEHNFTMRFLPDLIVEQVNAPASAFSATNISVSWKVKNQGAGSASGTWYDLVYLSSDAVLDVTDKYLGGITNPSGLSASQSYTQSMTVALPNGISGNYFVFVATEAYNYVTETDNNNNSARDTGKMVVTLTPPPDLIVTNVTRPATAFSGSPANLTFVVKNSGTGVTRSGGWNDRIFLSTEKVVNGSSYHLGDKHHSGNLDVDSTYSVNATVNIPQYISGKYFFVVQTDVNNHEYEHASESNNTRGSDTIKVILTPPPDLIVEGLSLPDTVSNSQSPTVSYNIINDGGNTTGGGFYDILFLCPTSTFNYSISHYIGSLLHGTLDKGDTSKVSQKFTITKNINGTFYLFVLTDYYNHINEPGYENNNTSSGFKIVVNSPELIVKRVTVSSTDTTGSTTPVSWTVKNQGKGSDLQGGRYDSIYISKSASWSRPLSTGIGRLKHDEFIKSGDSANKATVVTIPDGFDGNRYFYVVADATSDIYENGKDTNNYKRSNLMNVALAPYPDLTPALNSYPDSAAAGEVIGLSYKVKNIGTNKAKANWKEKFYFSKDSVFNPTKVALLGTFVRTSNLEVDSAYGSTVYFALPVALPRGDYFYHIFTDAELNVYEHFNDSNNKARSKRVFIDGYPPVDLRVNCPEIKDTLWSGTSYKLKYSVSNIGEAKTAIGAWNDGVYLSADSILTPSDMLISTVFINKALEKDSTYSIEKSVLVPNGIQGHYYLLIKADKDKLISDIDTSNNKKAVCKTTGGAKKLVINLTPPPDLQITSWNVPSTSTSGQPMRIKWKVENKGSGSTRSGAWKDQFFLSTDNVIDNGDVYLGERSHSDDLAVNGSYNDSIDATIPINKIGNFFVILKTDAANVEYEHTKEGNNSVTGITTAAQAPPADLIVSSVTAPDSVFSGHTMNVSWKVKNTGSNPASGYIRDNVYLSTDNIQDGGDKLLTSEYHYLSLVPNAENTLNKTVTVSGVPLGNYYVLVATDVLDNMSESNNSNNTNTAPELLNVNIPILPIAMKTPDTLSNNELIYHRIIVPDSLAGESMLVILKGDSVNGDNQIFVRYDAIASGSEFDFKYREPFQGNQEIIIPELKVGTYYLLTTGKTSTAVKQNISLLARIMPFEIRKVTPNVGGNTGEVTVLIEGSKLDSGVIFYLIDSISAGLLGTHPIDTGELYSNNSALLPTQVISVDPTQVYVTFNLEGHDTGYFDVVGVKELEQTNLKKGFKVVSGNIGELNVNVFRPGNTRTGNIVSMQVIYTNDGNTDLVNHKIMVTSNAGAPIAFTPEDLSKNMTTLEITVQENDGPPGRLRPGASGSIDIYTKATGALGFTIIK